MFHAWGVLLYFRGDDSLSLSLSLSSFSLLFFLGLNLSTGCWAIFFFLFLLQYWLKCSEELVFFSEGEKLQTSVHSSVALCVP
jgi:hypothetical protein